MKQFRRLLEAKAKVQKRIFYYTIDLEHSAIFSASQLEEARWPSVLEPAAK